MGKQAGNSVYSGITTIFTGSNNAVTGIAEQTWRLGGQSIHNIQQLMGQSVHYAGQLILNFVDFLVWLLVAILELFMSLFAFCWSFVSGLFNFGFSGKSFDVFKKYITM